MNAPGWDNFWQGQKESFNEVMTIGTHYFGDQLLKRFGISPVHSILDYGCGPGLLADHLALRQITIAGVDINTYFIDQCRQKHPGATFIAIATDPDQNKDILAGQLAESEFDFIILLSIAQYFSDVSMLGKVVQSVLPYLKLGGRLIVADVIDTRTSGIRDASALLVHCIRKGRIVAFTRFIAYLLFSDYRKISRNTELLKISAADIHRIAVAHGLQDERIDGLTIHPSRTSYVLTKVH